MNSLAIEIIMGQDEKPFKPTDFDKALNRHVKSYLNYLKSVEPTNDFRRVIENPHIQELAEIVATVALFDSSKRLEKLTKVLIIFTVTLVALTAVLIWRTILP